MYSEDVKRVDMDKKLELIQKMANSKIDKLTSELRIAKDLYMRVNSDKSINEFIVAEQRLKYYMMAINDMFEWLKMMED